VVVADDGTIRRIIPNGERPGGRKRSDRTSMTSIDVSFRSTRIARRSRVNASMTSSMRRFLPSCVFVGKTVPRTVFRSSSPSTKAQDQTGLGRSGRSRTQEPSVSHKRPFFGCLPGALSPSRRRSTSVLGPRADKVSPLDPRDGHGPARRLRHRGDPAVAMAAILRRQRADAGGERRVIGPPFRRLSLRRAVSPRHAARQPLGHVKFRHDVVDAATAAACGA
jgi:hypothetical protein